MALGKGLLGEEAVEKLKRGDLSELIKIGEKVLGEETVKTFSILQLKEHLLQKRMKNR